MPFVIEIGPALTPELELPAQPARPARSAMEKNELDKPAKTLLLCIEKQNELEIQRRIA
jgi:hypothetical protein